MDDTGIIQYIPPTLHSRLRLSYCIVSYRIIPYLSLFHFIVVYYRGELGWVGLGWFGLGWMCIGIGGMCIGIGGMSSEALATREDEELSQI